ncbi:hypothetical protein LOK49_LG01G01591 [Camellia lanceoleosa]|uniref:Uncharacterized protein n=1 Tax=Camellia lanceoleosa TaxID=1840588 RepID=A0ACC0IUG3_9ERIC|nr:hypothetical protein LOK49_LG01G01591 [Camellia lanceoleosa]
MVMSHPMGLSQFLIDQTQLEECGGVAEWEMVGFLRMVGVWAMCLWEQMGQPNGVNLIELGPGRGTLMADLLRSNITKLQMKTELCGRGSSEKRSISTLARTQIMACYTGAGSNRMYLCYLEFKISTF